jgi:hypothetical protein
LFNLAGGSWKQEATTILGSIHIERTWVLTCGAWIIWAYFFWRLWLVSPETLNRFRLDIRAEIARSRGFAQFTRRHLGWMMAALEAELVENALPPGVYDARAGNIRQALEQVRIAHEKQTTFQVVGLPAILLPTFEYSGRVSTNQDGADLRTYDHLPIKWEAMEAELPLPTRKRRAIALGAIWRAMRKRHTFSDEILPVVVAISAFVMGIARFIRHMYQ